MPVKNARSREIVFLIHDLHPWGGQDKVTLELLIRLRASFDISAMAFSLTPAFDKIRFTSVFPKINHPVLVKSFIYHLFTYFHFVLRKNKMPLLHAAGACSWMSDVIQVHFVHHAWLDKKQFEWTPDWFYRSLLGAYDRFSERISFSPRKHYIAVSDTVKQELRKHFPKIDPSHIEVVHPGVDTKFFFPLDSDLRVRNQKMRTKLGMSTESICYLFVGSFERKGLAVVLESLSLLSHRNWTLIVVGEGDIAKFSAQAEILGIDKRVQFLGRQKDLVPYYQSADFLLFPTLYEPFGLVVLEAMACGVIPVVSRLAGAAEVLDHGINAILLEDSRNVAELVSRLDSYAGRLEDWVHLRAGALESARRFDWDKVASRYAEALSRVLIRRNNENISHRL